MLLDSTGFCKGLERQAEGELTRRRSVLNPRFACRNLKDPLWLQWGGVDECPVE